MNTDTPTTNARWETLCCSGQSWYQIAEEMKLDCRQLERELAAVTEQRDRLAVALQLFLNRVQYTSAFMDGKLRGGTFDYRSSGFDGEVTQAYEALQSLTTNLPTSEKI
jgi:hypothetical protein